MVNVIIVAHVAVILRTDYNLHLGNHGIEAVSENTGVDTVLLACLQIGFLGLLLLRSRPLCCSQDGYQSRE